MILIFTALMALSLFDPKLPTPADLQTLPRAQIVNMYSAACLNFVTSPEMGGIDIGSILQKTLESPASFSSKSSTEKIEISKLVNFFTKICRSNPDLLAMDEFEGDIQAAEVKYQEMEAGLPGVDQIKNVKLSQATELHATDGSIIGEVYGKNGRRQWVSIKKLPAYVPKTFVAVEDRRFFDHKGVDELGILRALMTNVVSKRRPEGASTITQQVARNLFLDDSLSLERKVKEILLASKIEANLSKAQILELYLNLIYFGRNSWGIYDASQAYFQKAPSQLTVAEAAFLAGIVHSPNVYQTKSPRTLERLNFVLNKIVEENVIPSSTNLPSLVQSLAIQTRSHVPQGGYVKDYLLEELTAQNAQSILTTEPSVQTTINEKFQKRAETALQEGLIHYEKMVGRYTWRGPLINISSRLSTEMEDFNKKKELEDLAKSKAQESIFSSMVEAPAVPDEVAPSPAASNAPGWLNSLEYASRRFPIPVDSWQMAIVLENLSTVGLLNGSVVRLSAESLRWARPLKYGDVLYVTEDGHGAYSVTQVPQVNGAVVAMDVHTGQVLAMVGGFSYALSSWNRATKALRQPGSLVKPWTYMSALQLGYQPNTILKNDPISFPAMSPGGQTWSPHNYEATDFGPRPMRWALEESCNIMTADLMSKIGMSPIRILAREFGLYDNPVPFYPFILGAQETTLLALVRAYSAIANAGYLVTPQMIVPASGAAPAPKKIRGVDAVTLFQIRYLLQGVVARGTAARMSRLSNFVAGKTGTTEELKDAWFVGFTQNVALGVFVGYDQPTPLGKGAAGASVALPIFNNIIQSSFKFYKKAEAFPPAPAGVIMYPTDLQTGVIQPASTATTILEGYRESLFPKKDGGVPSLPK